MTKDKNKKTLSENIENSVKKIFGKTQAQKDLKALRMAFEELEVSEFIKYLRSPWRIMWHNFLAGIFRGLGIIVGMTVVFAFLIWLLTNLVDFPLIGSYFTDLKELLEQFAQTKNLAK